MSRSWIGFDLDGTLSEQTAWQGVEHIGAPIQPAIELLKFKLNCGVNVKIFTPRVCSKNKPEDIAKAKKAIEEWCEKYIGQKLEITAEKDWDLIEYYDDRAVQVEYNTGKLLISCIAEGDETYG